MKRPTNSELEAQNRCPCGSEATHFTIDGIDSKPICKSYPECGGITAFHLRRELEESQRETARLKALLDAATMFEYEGDQVFFVEIITNADDPGWSVSHVTDDGEVVEDAKGLPFEDAIALGKSLAAGVPRPAETH